MSEGTDLPDLLALVDAIPDGERPMPIHEIEKVWEEAFRNRLMVEMLYVGAQHEKTASVEAPFSPSKGDYLLSFSYARFPLALEGVMKMVGADKTRTYCKDQIVRMAVVRAFRSFKKDRILNIRVIGDAAPIPQLVGPGAEKDGKYLYVAVDPKLYRPFEMEQIDGKLVATPVYPFMPFRSNGYKQEGVEQFDK